MAQYLADAGFSVYLLMPKIKRQKPGKRAEGKMCQIATYACQQSENGIYCSVRMIIIPDIVALKRAGSRFSLHPHCFDSLEKEEYPYDPEHEDREKRFRDDRLPLR